MSDNNTLKGKLKIEDALLQLSPEEQLQIWSKCLKDNMTLDEYWESILRTETAGMARSGKNTVKSGNSPAGVQAVSVARRFNSGKAELSRLRDFPNARKELAKVCKMGADKYGNKNWSKGGRPISDYINSLDRHIDAFINEGDLDSESGVNHLAHAAWNCLALLELFIQNKVVDDRKC